jgi:cysteine desulfurase/selenocysteine lyase
MEFRTMIRRLLDPTLVATDFPRHPRCYFDNAAVGTAPAAIGPAVAAVGRALEEGLVGSPVWHSRTDRALDLLALDLGVSADRIVVLANASGAFNHVARAIPWQPEDEVVVFADDFPSPRMPWSKVPNIRVTEIRPGLDDERTNTLIAAITSCTRAVAVTEVHATTGTTLDLPRVALACRNADALLLVDGTQGAGILSGGAAHADVYIASSYKWLLAGFGAALVSTSDRFDAQAVPQLVGYRNVPPSPQLHVGHSNLFGLAALQAAAEIRQKIGAEPILEHTLALTDRIRIGGTELGLPLASLHANAGITSFRINNAEVLVGRLSKRGIRTAARDGCLRISPYLTTTSSDADRLLEALDAEINKYDHSADDTTSRGVHS